MTEIHAPFAEKIEVEILSAILAVGYRLQSDFLLHLNHFGNRLVFLRAQFGGVDVARFEFWRALRSHSGRCRLPTIGAERALALAMIDYPRSFVMASGVAAMPRD